jgi:hypothetical protein
LFAKLILSINKISYNDITNQQQCNFIITNSFYSNNYYINRNRKIVLKNMNIKRALKIKTKIRIIKKLLKNHEKIKRVSFISKLIKLQFLRYRFVIENTVFSIFKISNKVFIKSSYQLLSNDIPLLATTYTLYSNLRYLRSISYFIDAVNVVTLSTDFNLIDILLQFFVNELIKTRKHRYFLNTIRIILQEFFSYFHFNEKALKLLICGPIGKHGRTKFFKFAINSIQTQVYTLPILYKIDYCNTPYGTLGIRI